MGTAREGTHTGARKSLRYSPKSPAVRAVQSPGTVASMLLSSHSLGKRPAILLGLSAGAWGGRARGHQRPVRREIISEMFAVWQLKNRGSAFSLLNNKGEKNEKTECLLIVLVPGAVAFVAEAVLGRRGVFPACHIAAEYRRPAVNCENIRKIRHQIVCLRWSHFLLK